MSGVAIAWLCIVNSNFSIFNVHMLDPNVEMQIAPYLTGFSCKVSAKFGDKLSLRDVCTMFQYKRCNVLHFSMTR